MKQYKVELLRVEMKGNRGTGDWKYIKCEGKKKALELVAKLTKEQRTFSYIVVDGAEVDIERYVTGTLAYKNGKQII